MVTVCGKNAAYSNTKSAFIKYRVILIFENHLLEKAIHK